MVETYTTDWHISHMHQTESIFTTHAQGGQLFNSINALKLLPCTHRTGLLRSQTYQKRVHTTTEKDASGPQ